jgi:CubicO group peptidase (beta-lactamase class C family)
MPQRNDRPPGSARGFRLRVALAGAILLAAVQGCASQTGDSTRSAQAVATPLVVAPVPEPLDFHERLEQIRARHDLPALGLVAVQDGRIVARGVAGVRRGGSHEQVTINDRWHIGSCTKAMTATLCALLVDDATLRWDMTLGEAFPDLASRMHPDVARITLEHLLTNRSGLPADLAPDGLWAALWRQNADPRGTGKDGRRMLLEGLIARPPLHPPGTKFLYSNAGFALAGHMAEHRTGVPFEDLIRSRLFEPLGITSAGFGAPATPGHVDQPWGHTRAGAAVPPGPAADNPRGIAPAGTVHIALEDWAKFAAFHALTTEAADHRGHAGLSLRPATRTRLHTPFAGEGAPSDDTRRYAMGWSVGTRSWAGPLAQSPGRVLTHSGSNTMWFAVAWVAPERGLAIVAATNTGVPAGPKGVDEACAAVIGMLAPNRESAQDGPSPAASTSGVAR